MIKGKEREQGSSTKYVGFTRVTVKAINPTRSELNKLLGKEEGEDDKEINYLTQDQAGNNRIRLSFWLHDSKLDKYFVHSFNLTDKPRKSKDGVKNQYVNNSCITAWSDVEDNLPDWFTHFLDKGKNKITSKEYREALLGEEELVTLLHTWLGKMIWTETQSSVMIDTKALLNEDYSELRSLIGSSYVTPFVILTGVRTDENDPSKQYQQVYGKQFLPNGYMDYIERGFKFPNTYNQKQWDKFEATVNGDYGFNSFFELEPIKAYDPTKDPATFETNKVEVTPTNPKF